MIEEGMMSAHHAGDRSAVTLRISTRRGGILEIEIMDTEDKGIGFLASGITFDQRSLRSPANVKMGSFHVQGCPELPGQRQSILSRVIIKDQRRLCFRMLFTD